MSAPTPRDLSRLLRPKSIAVVGGGAWCRSVIAQCQKMGFTGTIWPVHPNATEIAGLACVPNIAALPDAPDATFIGVNRHATIEVIQSLNQRNAGGAVCFASGFLEAQNEDATAANLQMDLITAAGDMPILGPNCYGFINYLDGALLWPDQHGGLRTDKGVALITQSSNIAINLTMQQRALPIAYVVTAGNQAQTGLAEIGQALLHDPRVTALGLHIEGIGDIRAFEHLATTARTLGKRIIALKVGKSQQARAATVSHTASLAGDDAGASALLARLGIARTHDIPSLIETLKLLHTTGPLPSSRIATMSCSGGEASLAADTAHDLPLIFPPLNARQTADLRAALGPMVALANPLDYHTYIWGDVPAMTRTFAAMVDPALAMTLLIVDFPRPDRCDPADWDCTLDALIAAKIQTGGNIGLVATLPEALPEAISARLIAAGVTPFNGLREALTACALASQPLPSPAAPLCLPTPVTESDLIDEATAKSRLAAYGLSVPAGQTCDSVGLEHLPLDPAKTYVLKSLGLAHKSEYGAVALNLTSRTQIASAAARMPGTTFLLEEMIPDAIAELLIGVVNDPAHGFLMTLGSGGTLTEILQDSASFLLPASDHDISAALASLRISKLLNGYRGKPAANMPAIMQAIRAVEAYVLAHAGGLVEVEINPLLCTSTEAIAADALLRRKDPA
jgi:acyl-CoA synthetase (NDP forming)